MPKQEKNIITKHLQKTDTSAHWKVAEDAGVFKPLKGQIIYYQDEGQPIRYKVGDGKTLLRDLPFENEVVVKAKVVDKSESYTADQIYNESIDSVYFSSDNLPGSLIVTSNEESIDLMKLEWVTNDMIKECHFSIKANAKDIDDNDYVFTLSLRLEITETGRLYIDYDGANSPDGYSTSDFFGFINFELISYKEQPQLINSIEAGEGISVEANDNNIVISANIDTSEFATKEELDQKLNKTEEVFVFSYDSRVDWFDPTEYSFPYDEILTISSIEEDGEIEIWDGGDYVYETAYRITFKEKDDFSLWCILYPSDEFVAGTKIIIKQGYYDAAYEAYYPDIYRFDSISDKLKQINTLSMEMDNKISKDKGIIFNVYDRGGYIEFSGWADERPDDGDTFTVVGVGENYIELDPSIYINDITINEEDDIKVGMTVALYDNGDICDPEKTVSTVSDIFTIVDNKIITNAEHKANKEIKKVDKVDVNTVLINPDVSMWYDEGIYSAPTGTYTVSRVYNSYADLSDGSTIGAIVFNEYSEHYGNPYGLTFESSKVPTNISSGDTLTIECTSEGNYTFIGEILTLDVVDKANKEDLESAVNELEGSIKRSQTSAFISIGRLEESKANLDEDGKVPYEELPTMDLYLTTTNEETVDKIPSAESVRDCLSKKIEGYSSKYNVVEKGWHRVLNTIRGNPGQLYLTLTDGYSLQSLEIDLAGFVRLGNSIETPDDVGYLFCKSNSSYMYPRHSSVQADPYFKYKITAMRMGYASQKALKEKFDPAVSAGVSINSYIDIYIDYNASEDADKDAQLLVQFTGKGDQHNSYRIDEETTDTNYVTTAGNNIGEQVTLEHGLYGEALEFINVPIREEYDSVDEGYKSKLVDDFSVKVSDDDGDHTLLNEAHNFKNVSKMVAENPDGVYSGVDFRLYRKYNLLPLFSCHNSNDFFSRYDWKGTTINGKYRGGNLIYPFRSGKKTVAGVHYGITAAGTIIFDGGDTPTSISNINVYYSNQEETAIRLPAGTYMTNVNDLYYTNNLGAANQTKVLLSNYVGGTITNKCFKLDSPMYLTFARICVTPNHWSLDSSELGVYTPFLIKVPDEIQLGSKSNNAYTITDERWKNFSIKSSLEGEYPEFSVNADGWLELADKYSDYIIINDTYNNEVHHINKFDDFYSSWRASGYCRFDYENDWSVGPLEEIDFNKNQIIAADRDIVSSDNELLNVFNMYVDRSENPYDTLFAFDFDNLSPLPDDYFEIQHNDIRSAKSLFKKLDHIETILKDNGFI